jgi:hypothetical protein
VLVPGVDFVRNQMIFVFDLWKQESEEAGEEEQLAQDADREQEV